MPFFCAHIKFKEMPFMLFQFDSRHLSLIFNPMKKTLYTILFLLLGSLCNPASSRVSKNQYC